jgi:hypothetical protein
MRSSNGYITPLKKAGIYWKEKDGTFRAVERVRVERYELFKREKDNYNRVMRAIPQVKQKTLFSQPKTKQTATPVRKEQELSFVQRVVKSLFKL